MQKFWTIICAAFIAGGATAQTLIDIDAIGQCRTIEDPYERVVCYDNAFIARTIAPTAAPSVEPAPVATAPSLVEWANNASLPRETRLAAQVLGSPERTARGDYPIAVVDSQTAEMLPAPSSPLENFLATMSDDALAAAKYKRDYYIALPSEPESTDSAIMTLSCQKNITDFKVHFSKPFTRPEQEVIFTTANIALGSIQDQTQNERFVSDGYIMQMPRGLEGISLIRWIANGDELQMSTERNGEIVTVRFDTRELTAPLALLARQCSWN